MAQNHYIINNNEPDQDTGDGEYFLIDSKPSTINHHVIKLMAPIEYDHLGYAPVLNVLEGASENDKVTIELAGPGGSVDTGIVIVNAIRDCKCGVDIVVVGRCFSMHAILAVSGKSLVMKPNTWLMFHNYSGGESGKGTEMFDATIQTYKHIHQFFDDLATPFLSAEEITKVKSDKDVYIRASDKDLNKRIKRHFNGAKT